MILTSPCLRRLKVPLCAFFAGLLLGAFLVSIGIVLSAAAATGSIAPNANGTLQSTTVTCGAGGAYDCLDDGVTIAGTPSTAGDYLTLGNTSFDFYQLSTLTNVETVTSITLHFYHVEGGANAFGTLGLFAGDEVTEYGMTQSVPNRAIAQWDSLTFSGLALTQAQLDDLRVRFDCEKSSGGTSNLCYAYALYAEVTYTPVTNVTVSGVGTQQNVDTGATNAYLGGTFRLVENTVSRSITSITIAEEGTVDAQANLDNLKLYYDLDTTSPYDCASESYAGTEPQYGATDPDGFSGPNGTATFADSVIISTTQALCLYPVLDVGAGAAAGETIELSINNPNTDVQGTGAPWVQPSSQVSLPGTTVLQKVNLTQSRYHWRNDDGSEAAATSATGGGENTPYTTLGTEAPIRLRLAVSNEGNKTSASSQYRLEYTQKVTTCSDATGWADVGALGGDFDLADSTFLTNGADTTNVAVGDGGVTDDNTTFLTPNGGVRDTNSETSGLTLTSTQFIELEYALEATANAVEGNTFCFRVSNAGTALDTYTVYPQATILADVNVSALGAQPSYLDIPHPDALMGSFAFVDQTAGSGHEVTSVRLTATGTVGLTTELSNVRLYYDLDTTSPYDCASESYAGTEPQYGATDPDGFSGPNGTATFADSVIISTTQALCLYPVLDVSAGAADGGTLDVSIANASTDVAVSSGSVAPNAQVALTGTSQVVTPLPTLVHYHWRNDLGSEADAPSATNGSEDTALDLWKIGVPKGLRLAVANLGSTTTSPAQYRLEYSPRVSTCAAATGWTDVGSPGGFFDMFDSATLTDGEDTTNIAIATGGVSDAATTFVTPNGGVRDTSSQTSSITLPGDSFVELEYHLVPTTNVTEGLTYCFRVTDAGTPLAAYSLYPQAIIKPPTDFFVQRGVATLTGSSLTLTAGVDYLAPSSAQNAFIRITNTQLTGAGDSAAPANNNADDVTAYISNPENLTSSVTISRFGASGNTRVAWEIIEFTGAAGSNNELIVREQGTVTYTTTGTTVSTGAVANVTDDADVAVFITGQANPDTGRTNYNTGLATAAWDAGTDTATFTRGEAGADAVALSYAVVEFTGDNWRVQRAEHTYSGVTSTETESITPVGSLSRAFVHAQKRVGAGLNTHANIGHEVWLSGVGQVSFRLDNDATTPAGHTSVAWVIENVQTNGTPMLVTRSNGTQSGGAEPATFNIDIGKTLADLEVASLFMTNRSSGAVTTFPQPMIAARLLSRTQYELWVSKTSDTRNYRAVVVEWPTGTRELTQSYYRFYAHNDALTPTDPWPADVSGPADLGENTEVTIYDDPIAAGEVVRLRMSLRVGAAKMNPGVDAFKLQYGERVTTCSAISSWSDLGAPDSGAIWRGIDATPADGTPLSTDPPAGGALLLSVADVAGTYEESDPTALVPYQVDPGEDVEYDWVIEHNGAAQKTSYCFRMVESDGMRFEAYDYYPTIRTAGFTPLLSQWRFFDDEASLTPSTPLAGENVAPIDVVNDNVLKLRATVAETTGGDGVDAKFKLQFSEYSDFSAAVVDVVASSSCLANSLWCYADAAGENDALVDSAVLSDADACAGGVGEGCGTHNEGAASTTATADHAALATAEYEFTLRQAGARANAVYYFRLVDQATGEVVAASSSHPSVVVAGAQLVFNVSGLPAGTATEGVVSDVETTPTAISFSSVPFNTSYEAVYRFQIDTSATEGYQLYMYARQPLLNSYGTELPAIASSNDSPAGWASGCSPAATGCFGYHSGDDILAGGSTRFAPDDSYAALTTTPAEVMHSSVPTEDAVDLVFRVQVTEAQPAGDYETEIVYIAIPVF